MAYDSKLLLLPEFFFKTFTIIFCNFQLLEIIKKTRQIEFKILLFPFYFDFTIYSIFKNSNVFLIEFDTNMDKMIQQFTTINNIKMPLFILFLIGQILFFIYYYKTKKRLSN